jgi:hypothetical protein
MDMIMNAEDSGIKQSSDYVKICSQSAHLRRDQTLANKVKENGGFACQDKVTGRATKARPNKTTMLAYICYRNSD